MIDVCQHILPDFSKGASSMKESILMAQLAEQEGINTIIAAPIQNQNHKGSRNIILRQTSDLNTCLQEENLHVRVIPAQQVTINSDLLDDYEAGNLLCVNEDTDYLLLNFPQQDIPSYSGHYFYELQQRHITPVIVHPETHPVFHDNPERLYRFVRQGVLVQLSSQSLLGYNGKRVKRYAEKLIEANQAHFIGSATYKLNRKGVGLKTSYHTIKKAFGKNVTETFHENAQALISGQPIYLQKPNRVKVRKSIKHLFF